MNRLAGRVRDRINFDASCNQAMLLMFCRCDPFDRDAVERKAEERPESEGRNANCRVRCNFSLCVFVGQVSTGKNPNYCSLTVITARKEKSRPLDWRGRLSGELFGLACGLTACSFRKEVQQ